jgi:hypothetical protein
LVWGTEFRKSCFLLALNKNPETLSHRSEKLSQRDNFSKKKEKKVKIHVADYLNKISTITV